MNASIRQKYIFFVLFFFLFQTWFGFLFAYIQNTLQDNTAILHANDMPVAPSRKDLQLLVDHFFSLWGQVLN